MPARFEIKAVWTERLCGVVERARVTVSSLASDFARIETEQCPTVCIYKPKKKIEFH